MKMWAVIFREHKNDMHAAAALLRDAIQLGFWIIIKIQMTVCLMNFLNQVNKMHNG